MTNDLRWLVAICAGGHKDDEFDSSSFGLFPFLELAVAVMAAATFQSYLP
jgi:hypothetical protein